MDVLLRVSRGYGTRPREGVGVIRLHPNKKFHEFPVVFAS
jgi:hypothetical protein